MKILYYLITMYLCVGVFNSVALSETTSKIIDNQMVADTSRSDFNIKNKEAEDVLNTYLYALEAGDVRAIENLLSPELLRKRQRLLRNPSYPDFLRKWYANSSFEVFGFMKLDENRIMAEVIVLQNGSESKRFGIILIKTQAGQGQSETFLIQSDNAYIQPPK